MKKDLTTFSIGRMMRHGMDEEILELVDASTEGLASLLSAKILLHSDIEKILIACFRSDNAQKAIDIGRGIPTWMPMARIINLLAKGVIDINQINKEAFNAFTIARNWKDKTLANSALKCLQLLNLATYTTSQELGNKTLNSFLSLSVLESGLYISDVDIYNSVSSGSATRVLDICKKNNLGYLYVGNDAIVERAIYNGVRCYPLDIIKYNISLSDRIADKSNPSVSLSEISLLSLRCSRCCSISSLLENCLYTVAANIPKIFPNLKKIVIGYAWNTFMVSGLKKSDNRHFRLYVDTHDILSQRYDDLSSYGQQCYKISRQEEIRLLNHYDTSIYINSEDALRIDTLSSKLVVYPSINQIDTSPSCLSSNSSSDLIYIGGLQTANLTGLSWFASEVMPELGDITLNVWGSICRKFKVPLEATNKIHLRGSFATHHELAGTAKIGIAPLFYGSGTKLKIIEYLSLGLDIVGTDVALYGFNSLQNIKCFAANGKKEFNDKIIYLLSGSHKTEAIDASQYLPSPKIY